VTATGPSVRKVEVADRVLCDPEDRHEELHSKDFVPLRQRDIHAVAAPLVEAADLRGLHQ